jgi:glucokinase
MIHPETGAVTSRSTLRWSDPVRIVEEVSERLQVPVYIDNDINVAALGEMFSTSRERLESWAYISVATGVGSGIILNGQILRGFAGGAGELGHVSVNHQGIVCSCGSRGCLENYISSPAVSQRLGDVGDYSDCFRILSSRVKAQEPVALRVYEETVDYLATAIISILNLLNPFAVIIGGDILELGDAFLEDLRDEVGKGCGNVQFDCQQLVFSALGADAGLYGGAILTDQHVFGLPQVGVEVK